MKNLFELCELFEKTAAGKISFEKITKLLQQEADKKGFNYSLEELSEIEDLVTNTDPLDDVTFSALRDRKNKKEKRSKE